jgi:CYTH domain-containing protein
MGTKLEIERKYLVKFPSSWSALAELFDGIVDVKRISQTYLRAEPGEQASRVRKTVEGLSGETETVYHKNQKKPTGDTGVHEETESEISEKQYQQALKNSNPDKCAIEKTRFVFKWHDQVFELDLFKGHLKGLAILEIELEDKDDTVELPPFLRVIKEVTKDKKFTNFSLADKQLKEKANHVGRR